MKKAAEPRIKQLTKPKQQKTSLFSLQHQESQPTPVLQPETGATEKPKLKSHQSPGQLSN